MKNTNHLWQNTTLLLHSTAVGLLKSEFVLEFLLILRLSHNGTAAESGTVFIVILTYTELTLP